MWEWKERDERGWWANTLRQLPFGVRLSHEHTHFMVRHSLNLEAYSSDVQCLTGCFYSSVNNLTNGKWFALYFVGIFLGNWVLKNQEDFIIAKFAAVIRAHLFYYFDDLQSGSETWVKERWRGDTSLKNLRRIFLQMRLAETKVVG